MSRGKADISNTAVRIFLQEFGAAYDDERNLPRYSKAKHFGEISTFFGGRCCYCGSDLDGKGVQDHLIPLNRNGLGLHAWGNIVPSCGPCNAFKQGKPWHEVVAARAGDSAADRYKLISEFVNRYAYAPPYDLKSATADLYAEIGSVGMALVRTKIERTKEAT